MKQIGLVLCLFFTLVMHAFGIRDTTITKDVLLMGTKFQITVVASSSDIGNINIEEAIAEIQRIEALLSSWDPNSQTAEINRQAGIKAVKVDYELFHLIERAKHISKLTNGAFDVSYASVDKIWKFDGSMKGLPTDEMVRNSVKRIIIKILF